MRKQVFIVEGMHDASKLKQVLGDIDVITTNGSAISKETLDMIKVLDKTHDLIVFTDPDYAGERIRKIVSKNLEHVYHAFLDREESFSKNRKKIGIEHADKKAIFEALKHIQQSQQTNKHITFTDVYVLKLIGHKESKQKRAFLAKKLFLGHVNGKTLLSRLNLFGYTKEQVSEALHESST